MKGKQTSSFLFHFYVRRSKKTKKTRTTKIFQGTLKRALNADAADLYKNLNKNNDLKYYPVCYSLFRS